MSQKSPKSNSGADKSFNKGDASASHRLPFEPAQNRKKTPKKNVPAPATKGQDDENDRKTPIAKSAKDSVRESAAVPAVVSRRMVRRMAFFSGIPAFLGMLTFVVSYLVISRHWAELPHVAVLLVNMGFFGLSVLGLSYGAISASWDEDRVGTWFGWKEFTTNVARLTESWRSAKQKPSS